jgi:hypothetical protein
MELTLAPGSTGAVGDLRLGQAFRLTAILQGHGATEACATGEAWLAPVERCGRIRNGRVAFDGVPPGRYSLALRWRGTESFEVSKLEIRDRDVAVSVSSPGDPGHPIRGIVVGPDGLPAAGADVRIDRVAEPVVICEDCGVNRTDTAADGAFTIIAPASGRYRASAQMGLAESDSIELGVSAQARNDGIRLALRASESLGAAAVSTPARARADVVLDGIVVDDAGHWPALK